jgi:hypothetical protein
MQVTPVMEADARFDQRTPPQIWIVSPSPFGPTEAVKHPAPDGQSSSVAQSSTTGKPFPPQVAAHVAVA